MIARALVLGLLAAGACSDPTITITIDFGTDDVLRAATTRMRVTVHELTGIACDALEYGQVSPEALDLGQRTTVRFGLAPGAPSPTVALSDVPRLGPKLFVLEGFDALGQRVAGGCTEVGDIDADRAEVIAAEPAVLARVLPGPGQVPSLILPRLGADPAPPTLAMQARTVVRLHAAPAEAPVRIYLRSVTGEILLGEATPDREGAIAFALPNQLTRVRTGPMTSRAVVGPTELVIRAPWAEQPERVPAFVPVRSLGVVPLDTLTQPNQAVPHWAFVSRPALDIPANDVRAAAIRQLGAGPRTIVVATEDADQIVRVGAISSADADRTRALVGFDRGDARIVTRLDDGWYEIAAGGGALVPIAPYATTTADHLRAVPACLGPAPHQGLLARSGAGPWEGYSQPTTTRATGPVGDLATALTAFTATHPDARLENLLCVTIGMATALVAVVVTTGPTRVERYAIAPQVPPALLQFVGAVTVMKVERTGAMEPDLRPVGPIETGTGIRVVSYKVTAEPMTAPVLTPDGIVDYPVPGVPTDVMVDDANNDAIPDVLALTTYQGRLALSVTLGAEVEGAELTSLLPLDADPGSAQIGRALLLENVDLQLIAAGRSGLVAFDMANPATTQLEPPP